MAMSIRKALAFALATGGATGGYLLLNGPTLASGSQTVAGRSPTESAAPVAAYQRALSDMAANFWDAGARAREARIRPTEGDGGPRTGLVVDNAKVPTVWQMAQYANIEYNTWRLDRDHEAAQRIAANWRYVQSVATPAELASDGAADQTINISDDAAWKANYLAQVNEVTGDPKALEALLEMIPATLDRFARPGHPRVTLGRSPRGRIIAVGRQGILYAAANDRISLKRYCFCSSLYEAGLANAALYAFARSGNPAYRDYAVATWGWLQADLRTVHENEADAATGVYLTELLLPRTAGGHPTAARNRFWGRPIRGLSAEYGGGTLAMAVLSARLYRLTGEPRYLAEVRSIISAFPRLDAFGRNRKGKILLVNARDPWTEGYWYPAAVSEALSLPGVDPDHAFARALQNTARAIIVSRTAKGYYGADWSGPETNFSDRTRSWSEAAQRANEGRGGGQAAPEQIMTSASSVSVIQAAHAMAR